MDWIKDHRVRMLALNLITIMASLFTLRKNAPLFRFTMSVLASLPPQVSLLEKLKIARLVARNTGIYGIIRRNSSAGQIILADEGTLHIAHYLFVHVSVEPDLADVERFVQLVSLPNAVVLIRQPAPVLVSRTLKRGHKRIPDHSPDLTARFIEHGQAVFDQLAESKRLAGRLLIVNEGEVIKPGRDSGDAGILEHVRKIVEVESIHGGIPITSVLSEEMS